MFSYIINLAIFNSLLISDISNNTIYLLIKFIYYLLNHHFSISEKQSFSNILKSKILESLENRRFFRV